MRWMRIVLIVLCLSVIAGTAMAALRTLRGEPLPRADSENNPEDILHIRWKSLGEGVMYEVQVAKDSKFERIMLDEQTDKPEISLQRTLPAGIYYVRTRPVMLDGQKGEFLPVQILEVSAGLSAPRILLPEEISEFRSQYDIEFAWSSVRRADHYHVMLARDRAFKRIVYEDGDVSGTSLVIRNLDYGPHFFRIRAVTSDGTDGPFSNIRSFIIAPPTPLNIFEQQPVQK